MAPKEKYPLISNQPSEILLKSFYVIVIPVCQTFLISKCQEVFPIVSPACEGGRAGPPERPSRLGKFKLIV